MTPTSMGHPMHPRIWGHSNNSNSGVSAQGKRQPPRKWSRQDANHKGTVVCCCVGRPCCCGVGIYAVLWVSYVSLLFEKDYIFKEMGY